jgi:isoleucyl-tRNA synthetase
MLADPSHSSILHSRKTHFGPDTLRVWAASADYTSDSSIGKQAIDEASNHLFLVRRILRFLSGSVDETTRPITEHERDELTLVRRAAMDCSLP